MAWSVHCWLSAGLFRSSWWTSIRDHHNPRAQSALLDCLRTADQIVRLRGVGDSGNPWRADEAPLAPQRFGDDLDAVIARIGTLDKIVDEAMVFAQVAHE
jgi:hypothetical protein